MQTAKFLVGKTVADEHLVRRGRGISVPHFVAGCPQACPGQKLQKSQLQQITDGEGFIKRLGESIEIFAGQSRDQIRVDVDVSDAADAIQCRENLRRIGVPIDGAERVRVGGLHAALQLNPSLGHGRQGAEIFLIQKIGAHLKMVSLRKRIPGQSLPDGVRPAAVEIEGAIHEFNDGHTVHGLKLSKLRDGYLGGFCPHAPGGGGQAIRAAEGAAPGGFVIQNAAGFRVGRVQIVENPRRLKAAVGSAAEDGVTGRRIVAVIREGILALTGDDVIHEFYL